MKYNSEYLFHDVNHLLLKINKVSKSVRIVILQGSSLEALNHLK